MKGKYLLVPLLVGIFVLAGCKTTEKNYREAYERAVASNDRGVTEFDETIYSRYRNEMKEQTVTMGNGKTINTKSARLRVTEDGGGIPEWYKKYNVVVAEFKQKLNANSLRKRFAEGGYPRAFLVENGEPYYYVIVASSDNPIELSAIADSVQVDSPVPLKEGFPYILERR